jgi:geranylgeranyl pyrophosphate synthase
MKSKARKKLMEQVKEVFEKRGHKSFEIAKNAVLREEIRYEPIREALRYFMEDIWCDVQHPALLSLACEAVGGNPKVATHVGAAITLLTGAADVHDDIIDKSKTKASKPTLYGKFGKETAILVGDALIFEGLTLLHEACEKLPEKQRRAILNLTRQAFFELGSAEAEETTLKRKLDLIPEEYFPIIERKAAVGEMTMKIGAVLGGGKAKQTDALGQYGRTLGILMTIRDDFIDVFEPDELQNRVRNEVLPLPLLYAFKNPQTKSEIAPILLQKGITEDDAQRVVSTMLNSKEVKSLRQKMQSMINVEVRKLDSIENRRVRTFMKSLLKSSLEDI